ncbi:MAG: rhodanese-like domain-containing protein [Verrucomicrobiae bacterium]|nr:rhodanese-like domain-containing protein [Verrucomicrobiae bacterium]
MRLSAPVPQCLSAFTTDALHGALLLCVSLALGILANVLRHDPLPMVYQTPKERLRQSLQSLPAAAAKMQSGATTLIGKKTVRWINVDEARLLMGRQDVVFLDARDRQPFADGHVPGALNLPRHGYQEVLPDVFQQLVRPEVRQIVVYCKGGTCGDSEAIASLLDEMDFPDVRVIKGGWEEWHRQGGQLEKGKGRQP